MKTLFIVGATATGKTDLALSLVPVFRAFPQVTGVDILSADSKQVYIGQDIVTGKDTEKYTDVNVFGIDVVRPSEEWSVAHFITYAHDVFKGAQEKKRAVIVVGGTGLYLSSLLSPPATAHIPRNSELRERIETLSVKELQLLLQKLDPKRYASMNTSDNQNSRRLVRAIEVASSGVLLPPQHLEMNDAFFIGLTCKADLLQERIRARVIKRLDMGALKEGEILQQTYGDRWTKEAHSAIGYSEIESFLTGEISREKLVDLWTLHEVQYAKRQLQWFNSMKEIHWFSALDANVQEKIAMRVKDWYTHSQDGNR